jgi:hypothetical protein
VLERGLSILAALMVPMFGLLLQASRRNRLQHRVGELLRLAEQVRPHDQGAAVELERVAAEAARVLARRDQRWLRRTLNPDAIVGTAMLSAPGIVAVVLAWGSTTWLVVVGAVWTLLCVVAGFKEAMTERREDESASEPTPDLEASEATRA